MPADLGSSDIGARYEAAVAHQRAGRLADAEALYRAILAADPNHADALHMFGALALQAGRRDLAVPLIRRAVAVNPRRALYHITLGRAWLEAGDADSALNSFREAAAIAPDLAPAHFLIGMVLRQKDRLEEARAAFETALRFQPSLVQASFNLGAILQDEGDRAGAMARYRDALAANPDFAEAHLNLGICLAAEGDPRAALAHLERAATLQPQLLEAEVALGNALVELGEPERAVAHYRAALALNPDAAQAHFNLGNAYREQGKLEAALIAYRDALAADPQLAEAALNAGACSDDLGRYSEAEQHYRRAIASLDASLDGRRELNAASASTQRQAQRQAHMALAHASLSLALRREGRAAESVETAERAVALDPGLPDGHSALGLTLQDRGRFEEAAAAFRRALAVKPDFPTALFHLANLRGVEPTEAEVAAIERALAAPRLSRRTRIGLNFALASLCDQRGEYDKAFLHCKEANDLKAADQPFDHEGFARHVDALIATFDRTFFAARRDLGGSSERPVFVLGMPRSGTTLVEQILASHPEVRGAGELAASNAMIEGLMRLPKVVAAGKAYPAAAALLDGEEAQALAERYLDAVNGGSGEKRRVTDKMPGNFLRLGLIALLLPRAHVVHCMRDPFDTCLSCFFQNFQEPLPFTTELSRLGRYYREYERLMSHWRAVLPKPMLEVPYEGLVADPEPWCRRLLEYCGLPWDERVLRFFATERAVQTASFWQVRQPIYSSSVGRWRHYRTQLCSLFEALGREPDADAAG